MNDAIERWLPVPVPEFAEVYQVSDLGRVRSLDRMVRHSYGNLRLQRGRLLSPVLGKAGYLQVTLRRNDGECRIGRTCHIHVLVLGAFVGPRPPGQEGRHGPGGQRDNRLVNLCYGSRIENIMDKYRDGTMQRGTQVASAKLSEEIVRECRVRYAAGDGDTASLAKEFGVSQQGMWYAVHGETWRHVK